MPEGHLIHHYADTHQHAFGGCRIRVSSPQGRFAEGARKLDGRRLERVEAYGKHLFYWWEGDQILHVHLGMRGKFLEVTPGKDALPQSRLRLVTAGSAPAEPAIDRAGASRGTAMASAPRTADGAERTAGQVGRAIGANAGLELIAPATCELLSPAGRAVVVDRLGPDPLREDAEPAAAWAAITRSSRPIGALLLDQSVLSGVGNVLRTEGLFAAGIHPLTRGDALTEDDFDRLWARLRAMMRQAKADGRIITVRPTDRPVSEIPELEGRYVYKQKRCRRCDSLIDVYDLNGRTVYACPVDQPLRGDDGARR